MCIASSQWIENFFDCMSKENGCHLGIQCRVLIKNPCAGDRRKMFFHGQPVRGCVFFTVVTPTDWPSILHACTLLLVVWFNSWRMWVAFVPPFAFCVFTFSSLWEPTTTTSEQQPTALLSILSTAIIAACWCSSNRSTLHYFELTPKSHYLLSYAHNGWDWVK